MFYNVFVVAAFLSSASAMAVSGLVTSRQNGPDNCGAMLGDQCYAADLGFYSDGDCLNQFSTDCEYSLLCDAQSGDYSCGDGGLPDMSPYYVKVKDYANPNLQILFTEDESCPPSGPGAVFASLIANDACVEITLGGGGQGAGPGISIYPNGGAALTKRGNVTYVERENDLKRDDRTYLQLGAPNLRKRDPSCKGFTVDSQQPSESASVQVSDIVDCTNGGEMGCSITEGIEHTESITTSYSLMAGGGIEGIFDIGATFGMDYTESTTTTLQSSYGVASGQKGYLSAYCAATLFSGTFTNCDDGADHPGQSLVMKDGGVSYVVVNTGA